jgi:hypothetical protein
MHIAPSLPIKLIGVAAISMLILLAFNGPHDRATRFSGWSPPQAIGQLAAQPGAEPLVGSFAPLSASVPLSLDGDVGYNVQAALNASGGALREVLIQPGATWSFNATVGDPAQVSVRSVGGIPGGGWCDLASRYVQAVRHLLPPEAIEFPNHVQLNGIALADVDNNDAVSIWNIDGQPGNHGNRQDLLITNTLPAPLHLQIVELPGTGQLVVQAQVLEQ